MDTVSVRAVKRRGRRGGRMGTAQNSRQGAAWSLGRVRNMSVTTAAENGKTGSMGFETGCM